MHIKTLRNLFLRIIQLFNIKNNNDVEGIFLHTREIIERINDGIVLQSSTCIFVSKQ